MTQKKISIYKISGDQVYRPWRVWYPCQPYKTFHFDTWKNAMMGTELHIWCHHAKAAFKLGVSSRYGKETSQGHDED